MICCSRPRFNSDRVPGCRYASPNIDAHDTPPLARELHVEMAYVQHARPKGPPAVCESSHLPVIGGEWQHMIFFNFVSHSVCVCMYVIPIQLLNCVQWCTMHAYQLTIVHRI